MLTGLVPFYPLRGTEVTFKVLQGDRPAKPTNAIDLGISDGLWQLLVGCWNADDHKRPQIKEIVQYLSHEPARGRNYPPSGLSHAHSSYESIPMSATHNHGNGPRFKLACSRAYSPTDDIFHATPPETPTEGMPGATSWTIGLNISVIRIPTVPNAHDSYRLRPLQL